MATSSKGQIEITAMQDGSDPQAQVEGSAMLKELEELNSMSEVDYAKMRAEQDSRAGGPLNFLKQITNETNMNGTAPSTEDTQEQQLAESAPPQVEEPEAEKATQAKAGETEAAKKQAEVSKPDKSASTTDGEPGETSHPKDKDEEIDPWVKKRINRAGRAAARRERRRMQSELEAMRREIDSLRASKSGESETKEEVKAKPPVKASQATEEELQSMSREEYEAIYPMPEEEDYQDEMQWLEDFESWENQEPLKHMSSSKANGKAAPDKTADKSVPDSRQESSKESKYKENQSEKPIFTQEVNSAELWSQNIAEALQDYEDDSLFEDFESMAKSNQIVLSTHMLSRMQDNDEDAVRFAQIFINEPRQSRRIAAQPPSKQVVAMDRLLKASSKEAKPKAKESEKVESKSVAPDMNVIHSPGNNAPIDLEKVDFSTYEAHRRAQDSKRSLPFLR